MSTACEIDDETRILIEQLCTRAGMLMEDTSAEALVRSLSMGDLRTKIEQIEYAVCNMGRLINAAKALLNSEPES
jgi:hypothetical protein